MFVRSNYYFGDNRKSETRFDAKSDKLACFTWNRTVSFARRGRNSQNYLFGNYWKQRKSGGVLGRLVLSRSGTVLFRRLAVSPKTQKAIIK